LFPPPSSSSSSIHQQSAIIFLSNIKAQEPIVHYSQLISMSVLNTAMSCDEEIAQCGAWSALPALSHDHLRNTTASPHSTNTMDGSSDLSTDPSASPVDDQTNADRVFNPTSPASTTVVSGDIGSMYSMKTQLSDASADLLMDRDSVAFNEADSTTPLMQANTHAPNLEGLMHFTSPGPPLTTANLEAHERSMTASIRSDIPVASWLASSMGEYQPGDVVWSHLVASDPLAAEIEAAAGVNTHGQA
jgi:hypothetical protein